LPLDLPWRDVCGSLAVLLGVTAAAVLGRRRYPYLLVGWLWYLGMLAPVIGLLQVGTASVADRFTYLPQIGFALMLAWGAAEWCGPSAWRARTMGFAAAATLACLMGAAYLQTSYWRNSKTLWLHSLDCNRRDGFAYGSLGMCFQQAGRIDDAVFCYRNAIAIRPDDAVCNNLGVILAGRGELAEAEKCFRKALGITPDYDEAHCNLGRILADRGRLDEAIDHFRQSLQANPNRAEVFQRLGDALHRQGKATEAAAAWDKATELRQRRTDSKK
jgi:tetratricopeptide (TPR) repeat protein